MPGGDAESNGWPGFIYKVPHSPTIRQCCSTNDDDGCVLRGNAWNVLCWENEEREDDDDATTQLAFVYNGCSGFVGHRGTRSQAVLVYGR